MKKLVSIIFCTAILLACFSGCSNKKIKNIVWYVEDGTISNITSEEDYYKPIINEKTKAVNKRLENLNLDINIIFKAYKNDIFYTFSDDSLILNSNNNPISTIREIDENVDIITFSKENYAEYESLDSYLNDEESKQLASILIPKIWDSQRVFGEIYQVPKPGLLTNRYCYIIDKNFMMKNDLTEQDFQKTPLEVMETLSTLVTNDEDFKSKYLLTKPELINISEFFPSEYSTLMKNYNIGEGLLVRNSDNKVINIFDEPKLIEQFDIYQEIYKEDLDGHTQNINLPIIFSIGTVFPEEYYSNVEDSSNICIPFSDFLHAESTGYGILKDSKNKEEAFKALSATYSDAEISNILIYGIEEIDYRLKDGRAVSLKENNNSMPFGTFVDIGNNLISFPSEKEPVNKKELAEMYSEKIVLKDSNGFIPNYNTLQVEYNDLVRIYVEAMLKVQYSKIEDMNKFCLDVNEKLKEAGLDKVIIELQKQLDSYLGE